MQHLPSTPALIWTEARRQCQDGLSSSLPALVFVGLIGYLLTVLCSADYLREMGGAGVARNAPSMVYMMTSGQLFLLLFAWAWVFAQPIVCDRSAHLHELMLAAPVLEWAGIVPAGSIAATPWAALGQGWLLLIVPCAFGFGALYLLAALRTRSLAGPFAVAAALMLCWVLSMVVFDEQANDVWSRLLCPAGYTEVELQVKDWTAQEKASASLALTSTLLLNRLIWGVLPLFALGWALWRVRREALLLETAPSTPRRAPSVLPVSTTIMPLPRPVPRWWRAALAETRWQCAEVFRHKGIWLTVIGLAALNVAGAFNHIVGHAEGPLVPRTELIVPLIRKMSFFFIVFVVAGLAGLRMRRDDAPGFNEMLDACPAPDSVRLAGRAAAIVAVTLLLALVPGISSVLTAALAAPDSVNLALAVGDSLLVNLPALLEFAAAIVLMHALIRPAGTAYTASMLVAFVFLVNHEAELVTFPPAKLGIAVRVAFSALTGWQPWLQQVITMAAWKLSIAVLLLALAGLVQPRGSDGYWTTLRRNLPARLFKTPIGAVAVTAVIALATLAPHLHQRLIIEGGYRTLQQQLAEDAAWERHWLPHVAEFAVAGGARAKEIAPQLGFDRNRIIRSPNERQALALDSAIADLPARAATSLEAIAPAADWRWTLHLDDTVLDGGNTAFPLDFAAIWMPNADTRQIDTISVLHAPTHTQTARSIAADTADMQHCLIRRTGYSANIERIVQLPRGLGETALIGATLLLPEQYAWDIADTGTGRWLRRAAIAAALTRHHLHTHGDLRDSAAAQALPCPPCITPSRSTPPGCWRPRTQPTCTAVDTGTGRTTAGPNTPPSPT